MGNVNMEAAQIHDRTEAGKHQSVAEHLKALDALAQQIEDMPSYTSSDRAWLDEWESRLPELPEDPATDGVKVLTATTTSGETVKSWEEPESGGGVDYSTTEQDLGVKWIDGKEIYRKVVDFGALPNNTVKSVASGLTGETIVKMYGIAKSGTDFSPLPSTATNVIYTITLSYNATDHEINIYTATDMSSYSADIVLEYTKATV